MSRGVPLQRAVDLGERLWWRAVGRWQDAVNLVVWSMVGECVSYPFFTAGECSDLARALTWCGAHVGAALQAAGRYSERAAERAQRIVADWTAAEARIGRGL